MSLFFFGNSFYKNKETFNIFSPQILDVYRILLVETTLESIMFDYTFSVINTMFVPCTVWQQGSNSNITIVCNSIEHFLWISSDFFFWYVLSCLRVVFTNSIFQVHPQKIVRRVETLGIGWLGIINLTRNESIPWVVMPKLFKCFFREMRWRLVSRTERLNTSGTTSYGTD